MLILLGLSTLAAALVPQRTLNNGTNGTTTTTPSTSPTPSAAAPTGLPPQIPITVGPKRLPLVEARVGDQFTLLVTSMKPREISIPEFGLVGFASPDTPARFELLPDTPGTFGVLFATSGKPAAQLKVRGPKSRARAGSDPA